MGLSFIFKKSKKTTSASRNGAFSSHLRLRGPAPPFSHGRPYASKGGVGERGEDGSSGEGNGNPLQYSCLENLMARGASWATVHGVAKRWT